MTQYMLAVHNVEGQDNYPSDEAMQAAFAAVDQFNAKLVDEGSWVFGCGLMPAETATVVNATGGDVLVTDGPFPEAKEQLGGFWIIQAADLDAAMALAAEASVACGQPVEVRPLQDEPA
jgi:hypothetical protein